MYLLWHHAAHSIDLFMYQTGEKISDVHAVAGPINPDLGIYMDMGIIMRTPSGKICNLSLSFNNEGPLGTKEKREPNGSVQQILATMEVMEKIERMVGK